MATLSAMVMLDLAAMKYAQRQFKKIQEIENDANGPLTEHMGKYIGRLHRQGQFALDVRTMLRTTIRVARTNLRKLH